MWGHIEGLRVPMLECQECFHDVVCTFRLLEKFQRLWIDLEQDALFSSGLGQSLRSIAHVRTVAESQSAALTNCALTHRGIDATRDKDGPLYEAGKCLKMAHYRPDHARR